MQGKKGSKRIETIIKMVTEFKLTVVHFASPNPMQICACAWIYRWTKNCGKCGSGLRAARPSRAVGRGPRAAGPSGRQAAEPSRAVGRGPLGRGPAFSKTHRWKPFLRFKRELQTANVIARPWSRDILRFAVCRFS